MIDDKFYFLAHYLQHDGYGYGSYRTLATLLDMGARAEAIDLADEDNQLTRPGAQRWELDRPAVTLSLPDWWCYIDAPRLVGFTMFEATRLPAHRVALINGTADLCLVPCQFCLETFQAVGVNVPMGVVRWGIDPGDYWPMERDRGGDEPYTFLWTGTPDKRKGWDIVYRAFLAAFGKRADVLLRLHFRNLPDYWDGSCGDPNIRITSGTLTRPARRRMLQDADAYVFPSRGEGWGLPPREAAATGLPVMATDWAGLSEEIEQWAMPIPVAGFSPAQFGGWAAGSIGEWAEPDVDYLVDQMRWCFEHRTGAAALGLRAADWLAEFGTWKRTAEGILDALGVSL